MTISCMTERNNCSFFYTWKKFKSSVYSCRLKLRRCIENTILRKKTYNYYLPICLSQKSS